MRDPKSKAWVAHLEDCETCKRAIRGRFAGATGWQMSTRCCEAGRPLYIAFLKYNGNSSVAMKLVPIPISHWERETEPYENKAFAANGAARYLCKQGMQVFTSTLRVCEQPDATLPKNCERGCVYVDPGKNAVIPVDQLEELYYIEGGDL